MPVSAAPSTCRTFFRFPDESNKFLSSEGIHLDGDIISSCGLACVGNAPDSPDAFPGPGSASMLTTMTSHKCIMSMMAVEEKWVIYVESKNIKDKVSRTK